MRYMGFSCGAQAPGAHISVVAALRLSGFGVQAPGCEGFRSAGTQAQQLHGMLKSPWTRD